MKGAGHMKTFFWLSPTSDHCSLSYLLVIFFLKSLNNLTLYPMCVSAARICAQLHYQLNLQTRKQHLSLSLSKDPSVQRTGLGSSERHKESWARAAGGGGPALNILNRFDVFQLLIGVWCMEQHEHWPDMNLSTSV